MFHKIGVIPYGPSNSAKFIRRALHLKRFISGHRYGLLINWGCASHDKIQARYANLLNHPDCVKNCTDKTRTYDLLKEANIDTVEWTTDINKAKQFGYPLLLRRNFLSQGRGISFINNEGELRQLRGGEYYAKFYPSVGEYRVHIFGNELIGWQKKICQNEDENLIRSHDNGYRFSLRNSEGIQQSLLQKCVAAISALGLDFGAVDVLLDSRKHYRILEVNSAPGLDEGTILEKYVEKFRTLE